MAICGEVVRGSRRQQLLWRRMLSVRRGLVDGTPTLSCEMYRGKPLCCDKEVSLNANRKPACLETKVAVPTPDQGLFYNNLLKLYLFIITQIAKRMCNKAV